MKYVKMLSSVLIGAAVAGGTLAATAAPAPARSNPPPALARVDAVGVAERFCAAWWAADRSRAAGFATPQVAASVPAGPVAVVAAPVGVIADRSAAGVGVVVTAPTRDGGLVALQTLVGRGAAGRLVVTEVES